MVDADSKKRETLPRQRWKLVLFSLLPLLILLAAAEMIVRVTRVARPQLHTVPLPEEAVGIFQPDPDLFWSMQPGVQREWERAHVTINSIGLRTPEIRPKQDGEFRILSIGESSTFGVGVEDDETYSAGLQQLLRERHPGSNITVINAGVAAYSSFQGLKYLELRGIELEPDAVLFYHELNDYLPSTLRDSSNNELGMTKTDRELYDSRFQSMHRALMDVSALYRFLNYRYAYLKIRRFNREEFLNPLNTIGLPDMSLPPRVIQGDDPRGEFAGLNEKALGRRVSDEERRDNLEALVELCERWGIRLVIMHPAYRDSVSHECLLTRLCAERGALMFETYHVLHPPGSSPRDMYVDAWHPNREGHARLAAELADFVSEHILP